MKRIVLLALTLSLAPATMAELYKYVDKDGKTVYSDTPPVNVDSKQLKIQNAPVAAPAKSALDKDKDLEKGRKEVRETAKKGEDAAKNAQAAEQRCANARNNYQVYSEGQRLMKRTESGERVFLDDNEIAAEKERARAEMEQACKKS